uniref:Uncharacterized protein n=1 Tax=Arundo donax TaxID=35708 RepID=A0A0A9AAE1_ARUDO
MHVKLFMCKIFYVSYHPCKSITIYYTLLLCENCFGM